MNRSSVTRLHWLRLGLLAALLLALGAVTLIWGADAVRDRIDGVADSGWRGVAVFVVLYALATVLLVPGSATTITAGVVYGIVPGAMVAVAGATVGSTVAYAIARGAGRGAAEAVVAPHIPRVEAWLADRQFRSILVMRLLPVVPFNVFNYAAGLTPVRPRPYIAGTVLGLVPGALLLAAVGSSATQPTSPAFVSSVGLFVLLTVVSAGVARRMRRR